jgi:hypothetical protein
VEFQLADMFDRRFPACKFKRSPHRFPIQCPLNPDGTETRLVSARAMFAILFVSAVWREHGTLQVRHFIQNWKSK